MYVNLIENIQVYTLHMTLINTCYIFKQYDSKLRYLHFKR